MVIFVNNFFQNRVTTSELQRCMTQHWAPLCGADGRLTLAQLAAALRVPEGAACLRALYDCMDEVGVFSCFYLTFCC